GIFILDSSASRGGAFQPIQYLGKNRKMRITPTLSAVIDRRYSYNLPMRFGISTQIQRGSTVTLDLLESIRKAGYNRFELFCNRPHLDFHSRSLMRSIGRWFGENALPAPSIHLPFIEGGGKEER